MPKKKTKADPKLQARLDAKVRPDEPVKEDRIYLNMPKKKAPAKRVSLMCEACGFKIMVPTKKFENGEVALECAIHGKPMEEQKA